MEEIVIEEIGSSSHVPIPQPASAQSELLVDLSIALCKGTCSTSNPYHIAYPLPNMLLCLLFLLCPFHRKDTKHFLTQDGGRL